jgi:hypothetical protein
VCVYSNLGVVLTKFPDRNFVNVELLFLYLQGMPCSPCFMMNVIINVLVSWLIGGCFLSLLDLDNSSDKDDDDDSAHCISVAGVASKSKCK